MAKFMMWFEGNEIEPYFYLIAALDFNSAIRAAELFGQKYGLNLLAITPYRE